MGCLWGLSSAIVAIMPMRFLDMPGLALMRAAPVVLWWIASALGGRVHLAMACGLSVASGQARFDAAC